MAQGSRSSTFTTKGAEAQQSPKLQSRVQGRVGGVCKQMRLKMMGQKGLRQTGKWRAQQGKKENKESFGAAENPPACPSPSPKPGWKIQNILKEHQGLRNPLTLPFSLPAAWEPLQCQWDYYYYCYHYYYSNPSSSLESRGGLQKTPNCKEFSFFSSLELCLLLMTFSSIKAKNNTPY